MPVNLARVRTADDRHKERVGCVGEAPEAAVDADWHVEHVALMALRATGEAIDGALFLKHSTHEVDCVLRVKLFHDVRTVKFDGTRTDTEQASGFFT
jgi:hypothetical protein